VVLLLSFPNLGITAHPKRTSTHTYISRKWFFVQLFHPLLFTRAVFGRIKGVLRILDQGWTSILGPIGRANLLVLLSQLISKAQRGQTSNYLSYILIIGRILLSTGLLYA
jgi:hypothetical protein